MFHMCIHAFGASRQGFLPFPVGDSLFKDTLDGSAFTAIIGDPIQAFAISKRVVFVIDALVA